MLLVLLSLLCNMQNQLQFTFSRADHLFRTMVPPLSIALLMVATLLPVVFHGSRMAVISTASNDQLMISVAANDTHPFGRYKCVVNNSVATMESSFLIKQKGDKDVDSYSMFYYNTDHIYKSCGRQGWALALLAP